MPSRFGAGMSYPPATEKAVEWLQTLAPQQFIGTESRLLRLFQLLRGPACVRPACRQGSVSLNSSIALQLLTYVPFSLIFQKRPK